MGSILVNDTKRVVHISTCDNNKPNAILTFKTDPQLSTTYETHRVHSGSITCMLLSRDGNTLYSGDSHGVIIVSEIQDSEKATKEARKAVTTSDFTFTEEIMVKKNVFEDKKTMIDSMNHKIEEMTVNNEHQLRVKEMDHKKRVRQITDENVALLATEKEKYAVLSAAKKDLDESHFQLQEEIGKITPQYEFVNLIASNQYIFMLDMH